MRAALVLIAACGAPPAASAPSNHGGDPVTPVVDGSLHGPYADLAAIAEANNYGRDARVTTLGAGRDGDTWIALRELRSSTTGASCLVTVETAAGLFAGDSFLCDATRSDETATTEAVRVEVRDHRATVRFRTSYQLDGTPPEVGDYQIVCALVEPLSCSAPPRIGGYE